MIPNAIVNTTDPGCVSNTSGSMDWLQRNFGIFSVFAELQELQVLNPHFSSKESLSLLTPTQVAQLTLTSGALNDTDDIKLVFTRLEEGDAFKNVDEFLTQLTAKEEIPDIHPAVRDVMMNQTFNIISLQFPEFETLDWIAWFEVKLIPILPSFNEVMLTIATSNVNCTNYQVIVNGMDRAFPEMTQDRREGIARVLLKYLRKSVHLTNRPACRQDIHDDNDWLAINLGSYSEYTTYSDLKDFNISGVAVLDSLSPNQKAELILDPSTGALENETLVKNVFISLLESPREEQLNEFFVTFVEVTKQENITIITNTAVRDTMLDLTLMALAPKFDVFEPKDFQLWFQIYGSRPKFGISSASPLTGCKVKLGCTDEDIPTAKKHWSMRNNFVLDLTADNLVTILKCQLSSKKTYSTEMWKLFFQNNAAILDQALLDYSSMNPNTSSPAMPNVLDAIGDVKLNNFMNAQLNNASFVDKLFQKMLRPFLSSPSRNFLSCLSSKNFSYPGCVSNTSGSMDWLQRNFGIFSVFAELQELQVLNPHFSSKESLSLLTPTQVAQLTLTSGALNDTDDIKLVFTRLEEGDAFKNVDEFLTQLTAKEEIPDIHPAVRDVMMNQTFNIISLQFPEFETLDWIAWFEVKLIPILPSFNEVMLTIATSNVNCTNYQVIVNGMDRAFPEMTQDRREGIARVLLKYLRKSVHLINGPVCRQDIHDDNDWLAINLGSYSEYTTYSDLKDFNISGLAGISKEEQLNEFFVTFVEVTKQENITIITNTAVRDTMLDLTLMALAPKFDVFEPKDFQLWFQIYGSRPKFGISSASPLTGCKVKLGCTDEDIPTAKKHWSMRNNFVLDLTADNLVTILNCQLSSKKTYSTEMWKLFFQNNAAILDQALLDYSSMNPNTSSPAMPNVLDAIGDVKLNNFMNAQLNNASFVDKLFQKMLRPFLASPSRNFLSCLSSKNFSCLTYQIVIEALSNQSASMDREQQRVIFTHYIYPFLSRNDSSDPGCVSNTSGSMDWLQRNFGIFSVFAELQELQVLNPHFSSKESLSLLTPTQVAQLTLTSGALNDTDDIKLVFTRLEEGDAFKNVDEFLTQLTAKEEIPDIHPAVRDVMMNQTFNIISLQFPEFETLDWIAWFEVKLIPILPSFNEVMLTIATSNVNCTNYQVIVNGMDRAFPEMTQDRREGIARVLLKYLRKSVHLINGPACRQDIHDDNDWLAINLGSYSEYTTYSDLKDFNISGVAVLDSLSPNQKAELILDPSTGALENETLVKNVFISLLESPREEQLNEFFVTFVEVTKQENITIITNTAVRDTMLDLTLMALAPKFDVFEPKDFQLWFQVNLVVLLASFHPGRLVDIPLNITCESYNAIFTGLDQSLESLPPHLSQGVKSSLDALMKTFQRCSRPPALIVCKETLVNEKQLCAGFNSTQLKQQMSIGNLNESLCNFNISEYACSSTTLLSADNLVTILKCQLSSKKTYSTEMWKLFFQNNAAILDQALLDYSSMNPNTSSPAMPNVLDAIGDVKLNNFMNAQLNNASFVDKLFQKMLRPFLASPSRNFLSCLSSKNFSCQTYQIVIEALSNQSASMDREQQRVIFTHYIYPFLSRNDSSDPGCVSNTSGSMDWLQRNFGIFSVFAELQELQVLNPHFSSKESLSLLTPTQVAQLTLTSGALNDTDDIKLVFTRLEEGDAFKNVDEFLTQLTAKEEIPDIHPAVRDVMMNQTFNIISLQFPEFETLDWIAWFEVKLIPILPSFNEVMLTIATSNVNCTNYQVIVNGMDRAFPEMTQDRREGIARVLLKYLRKSVHLINGPACRQDIHDDNDWLAINLGSYSEYTTYSDLKDFNISGVAVLDSLSPNQKAELILDPSTGALENETLVKNVFISLLESPREEQLNEFFVTFVEVTKQENITIITNTAVRDTMLDLTLMALAPKFDVFEPKDFQLWFQVNLVVLLASFHPGRLVDIPLNITCESYNAIFTGLDQSLESLPPHLSQGVKSSLDALMKTFQPNNLVTILKCQLSSKKTYSAEMWKLFFQNNAAILDQALLDYSSMNPNTSSPAMPNVLDAIGDVKLNNFMNAQLNNASFVDKLFQKMLRPFLSSPSRNFLSCLSSKNFSCLTYQIVIEALSNQSASMDREQQRVIFTHYIYPFLSRNDSSDPGCVSNTSGSMDWLQRNFGIFSVFAELQELQVLNPHFSSKESLSLLTPTQVAQLTLTSGALNDTDDIKLVFTRLEEGDAFKNVDEFLTQLTAKEEIPDIHPAVRDVMMNQTFKIISLQFPEFETLDWIAWFEVKLIPILPSFNEVMLTIATSNINCTNYQVIVNGMDRAFPEMTQDRREGIARVLLKYLRKSVHLINGPVCRQDIHDDNDWLAINLGSYSEYTTYSDLKDFNISGVAVLDSLSPNQKAELILDPSTGALENETLVKNVFISLLESPREEQLNEFFVTFVEVTKQENITIITNTAVRDTMLDLTLMALAPKFDVFEPKDFQLWFQVNLVVLLASFHPGRLVDIPLNITCESYNAIFTGLDQSLESLPPHLSQGVKSSLDALMKTFQRCSRPPALIVCKETLVNEKQLCAGFNSTQLKQQMSIGNLNESLCNFNISEYACSSTTLLSADNLVTILKCQLSSKKTYSTEMWKLFFQNNAAILDQALLDYSSMNPNTSSPAMPNVLDAIGDVKLNNFMNAQLNNASFVDKLFQKMLRPFLASPSRNFLSCLSSKNFSCLTYQIVYVKP
uniref:uncharacterized protein LOC124002287 n=1 Tax=Oncorhynchus gorbuscha TaxID=8017 RepID=UPI001EAF789C|nr:uncharacterized protein LOC124002287 [Oncorhynchus gorbuscha]